MYSEEVSVHISSVSELTGVCVSYQVYVEMTHCTDVQWLLAVRWSDKLLLLLAL